MKKTSPKTRSVTFRVRCTGPGACLATGPSRAWYLISEANAVVTDPVAPTVAPLTLPTGWARSTNVTFAAEDNTGVRTLVLRAGGQTLDTRAQTCDFTHLQPCPLKVTASTTPNLPDGVHELSVVAVDAGDGTSTSAPATLKLDRTAPAAPTGLAVERRDDNTYVYTWKNPDQGGMAPIVAAHLSDGTVVRGANIERLEAKNPDAAVYLEDEAGNADPATAVRLTTNILTPIAMQPPILQQTVRSAAATKLKLTSAKRSGTRLLIKGTIAREITGKVTATLTRGKRRASASAKPVNGRFTIRLAIPSTLRRKGTNTLTVRFGGQGDFAPATVRKRLTTR